MLTGHRTWMFPPFRGAKGGAIAKSYFNGQVAFMLQIRSTTLLE